MFQPVGGHRAETGFRGGDGGAVGFSKLHEEPHLAVGDKAAGQRIGPPEGKTDHSPGPAILILIDAGLGIASPEMFLNAEPLPHVICSRSWKERGGCDEAIDDGDAKGTDDGAGGALSDGGPCGCSMLLIRAEWPILLIGGDKTGDSRFHKSMSAKADIDAETFRQGRPYSLVCTKSASYERRVVRRGEDLRNVSIIEG
ncbi:hypothetical protein [Methylosinus sp. PW1]|uniref:hypothetical protein n=1 Tax=Methylosinus sp. PW1 TaxID=107636 RepID=UPI001FD971AE|nr:hypothetical protein [Methylosinus sp. PW1]